MTVVIWKFKLQHEKHVDSWSSFKWLSALRNLAFQGWILINVNKESQPEHKKHTWNTWNAGDSFSKYLKSNQQHFFLNLNERSWRKNPKRLYYRYDFKKELVGFAQKTSFNYSILKFILPAVLRITRGKQRPNGWAARRRCLLRLFPIGQFLWLSHVNSPGIRWKFPGSSVPCVLDAPVLKRSEISGILQIWAQQTTQRQLWQNIFCHSNDLLCLCGRRGECHVMMILNIANMQSL